MSNGQAPVPKPPIPLIELNGRISELERQRNEAQTRCAQLSGIVELLKDALSTAKSEIERLSSVQDKAGALEVMEHVPLEGQPVN